MRKNSFIVSWITPFPWLSRLSNERKLPELLVSLGRKRWAEWATSFPRFSGASQNTRFGFTSPSSLRRAVEIKCLEMTRSTEGWELSASVISRVRGSPVICSAKQTSSLHHWRPLPSLQLLWTLQKGAAARPPWVWANLLPLWNMHIPWPWSFSHSAYTHGSNPGSKVTWQALTPQKPVPQAGHIDALCTPAPPPQWCPTHPHAPDAGFTHPLRCTHTSDTGATAPPGAPASGTRRQEGSPWRWPPPIRKKWTGVLL